MRNIWTLFCGDLKRLTSNVVTVIIVLGLVFLPSLFSWYNLIACWNVFDNTGNLKVAVANADEGYSSDLMPIEVNIGEKVVSELRANDQLEWTFTSVDDAIDGAKSGRYYAAVVIPESFSRDMMTFFSDDVEHAEIIYYSNEKKNAIAPKLTDQGADKVSAEVNQVFAKTLSEAALGISSAVFEYADDADLQGRLGDLSKHVASLGSQMAKASSLLTTYSSVLVSSQAIIEDSAKLIAQVKDASSDVVSSIGDAKQAAGDIAGAMESSMTALSTALSQSSESYGAVGEAVDAAFASTDALSANAASQMRSQSDSIDRQIEGYRSLVASLEQVKPSLPADDQPLIDTLITRLNASIELQEQLRDALRSGADGVEIKQLAGQASQSLGDAKVEYDQNIKPSLDELASTVTDAGSSLSSTTALLTSVGGDLSGTANSMSSVLGNAKQKLDEASSELSQTSESLAQLSQRMNEALAAGDIDALREIIGSDPTALASALSAPVQLDRHAIYPVDDFGSAMSPLYTTLALWIGALLMMVTLKVVPGARTLEQLDNPTAPQLFLGRFGSVALLSLLQSTILALGNMLFLRVQVADPLLYLVCFWVAGLVFAFIIYTLVVSFANLGKALSVFLLIIQVSGGGGSYPLQLLPDFVQNLSPYLPITHAVNAMRAAMFGVYQGDFWIEIGVLLLFCIPFVLLGLVLRNPLIKIVSKFVEKVESTKVM